MKKSLRRFIYILISLFIFLLALIFVSKALMRDETYNKYETFKQSNTDYDVLFLGSSHVLNAIFPMQLWNDYGITSYNLAWHGMSVVPNYWILQTSVSYHKPKIAVLDILGINNSSKGVSRGYFHGFYDNFPITKTKISAINDLFPSTKERMEFLIPFTFYHNNWYGKNPLSKIKQGIKRELRLYSPHVTKGADLRIGVKKNETFNMSVNKYEGKESAGIEYAKKFIEYCRNNEIEPVFVFIPYSEQGNLYEWRDALISILEEEKVLFIDLTDGVVDFDIDQFDQNSHVNPSGARKVTDAIGKALVHNYLLENHKDDKKFASWNDDYEKYKDFLFSKIEEQSDFKNLLMMLNNSEVYAKMSTKSNVSFNETERKLIFGNWSKIDFAKNDDLDCDVQVEVFSEENNSLICERKYNIDKVAVQ